MTARILLVVDALDLRQTLQDRLEREGWTTVATGDRDEALELVRRRRFDCVVLDAALPRPSGHELRGRLRSAGLDVPVILLTDRADLAGRVAGPAAGEDDHLAKPFEADELAARVAAVLRRSGPASGGAVAAIVEEAHESRGVDRTIACFDLEISPTLREVRRAGVRIELARVDVDLLLLMARTPGRAWDREQLGVVLFGEEWDPVDRTLDDHLRRIRDALGPRPDGGSYVEPAGGSGYRVARPDQDS